MFSREDFVNLILMRDRKESRENDAHPYDNPDSSTCMFTSMQWIRTHVKMLLFMVLIVTSIALAILVSLLAWSYVSKGYNISEVPLVKHRPNKINLYTHEEQEFHIPDKGSGLDGDISESVSLNFNGLNQAEKPYFIDSKSKQIAFEQQTDQNAVSHNEIYREENADDAVTENASPDEYREHLHRKRIKSKFREENADTREKNVDFVELRATTVPVTDGKGYHEPPGNPKPTILPENSKPTLIPVDVINEQLATESKPSSDSADTPMQLYRVENAVKAGAVCLDGSAPAYYHRPGRGSSKHLWIIHFNGGAWCFDAKACFERSLSSLGSTRKLPPSPPIIQGINSPDPTVNPDFYDWNLVWVVYCDGASFTGNRERPLISDSGATIYMRGKRVLNAIVNDLLYNRDFKLAEAIILTGSSAGSMTAMFQADYIASKFPKTIPVRVLSDAGFFIDTAPIGGKNLGAMFKHIYELQNSSAGLNQDCVRDLGLDDAWQCFLPAKSIKYIKTPMFILNSAYDIWALIYFLNIDCKYPSQEQKQRKKRNVDQRLFIRSDSELEISFKIKDIDVSMFRRDVSIYSKRKRDVSGFEMMPFFRRISVTRDAIPTDSPTVSTTSNTYVSAVNVDNSTDVDRNLLEALKSAGNSTISDKTLTINDKSPVNNTTIGDKEGKDDNKPKNKEKNFISLLKNLGSITTDNDMNILFHDINADTTYRNDTNEKSNDNKNYGNLEIKNNSDVSNKHNSNLVKGLEVNSMPTKKNVTNLDNYDEEHERPTSKSVIPPSEENRLAELKESLEENLKHFPLKKSALQKLDERRKQSRQNLNSQSRHRNNSIGFKRHSLNKDKNALKSRRSTSIAREYINILRSDPPECTEKEILNSMKYRAQILRATDGLMHMPKSGRFLVSCIDHSLSLFDETWSGLAIKGKSIQQAFGDWFYERGSKAKHNLVDCPYPCNPSCP